MGNNNIVPTEDIKALVHSIYDGEKKVAAAEIFMSAVDLEEVIRLGLQRAELEIMTHVSDIIKALVNQAKEGDVSASKLLFEAVGLVGKRGFGSSTTFVNNQVNLSPQDIERIVRGLDSLDAYDAYEYGTDEPPKDN